MNRKHLYLVTAALGLAFLAACSGDSPEAKKRLLETANKYHASGKYKEASLLYRKILAKDALYGEAYYRLGLTELAQSKPADALRALRRASELQPQNNDAHSKLADMYMAIYLSDRKRYKELLGDLREMKDRLMKLNPRSFEGLRIEGYLELAEGNMPKAVEKFEAADQVSPNNAQLGLILGEALYQIKKTPEAIARLNSVIDKHKTFLPAYDALYVMKASTGDEAGAEQVLRQKIANSGPSAIPHLELAGHFMRLKQRDEAAKVLATLKGDLNKYPEAYQQAGDFYFRMGIPEEAQREYEAGIKATPKLALPLQKRLIELLAAQGKTAEATELASKVVADNKDDSEAQALRASLRLRSGKKEEIDQAVKEMNTVLPKMPNNPVLRFNLGEAHLSLGEVDKAQNQMLEAVKLRPNYIPPKVTLSRIHLIKGEFGKAQQFADEVIQANPNLVLPYLLKSAALTGINDFKTARAQLETVLARKSDLRDAQYLLAQVNMLDKKSNAAEEGFRGLMGHGDRRGVFGLVDVMIQTKRQEQATQILKKELASAKDPTYARALRTALGMVAVSARNFPEATEYYEAILKDSPDSSDILMRLGDAYNRSGKHDQAYQTYERARKLLPNQMEPLLQMALALEGAGKRNEAKPLYEQILKQQPDNAVALNNLAYWLLDNNGDLDLALSYAQRAKQKLPQNPEVSDTLGLVYVRKNLIEDAIRIYNDLLRQNPAHVNWRYHLALALAKKGDKVQARKELETARKNKPSADEQRKIDTLMNQLAG